MKLVVTTTTILLLLTTTTMTGFLPLAHAGTNKTLAPTPGVVRPTVRAFFGLEGIDTERETMSHTHTNVSHTRLHSVQSKTPFPTEFVNTPPPTYVLTTPIPSPAPMALPPLAVITPSPMMTVTTPSPTPCLERLFWYDGQVCTNGGSMPPGGGEETSYETVQECCNANFGPGSHVDETCDYVNVCYDAPPEEPGMSMAWDIVENFGKSGKTSSSGYEESYDMVDDYTGNSHDSSKSGKGTSKGGKGGGKSSKGSGSSENYSHEGYGYGDYSNNDYNGGHTSSGKSDKTGSGSNSGGGYGYTDDYANGSSPGSSKGSKDTSDTGKSGKSSGSSGKSGKGSGSSSNEYGNKYDGYAPAKGYRLGSASFRANVIAVQLAKDVKQLDNEPGGTNKTLAPTPGFLRPSTPFPTEFVNTPAPTIVTPAPTICEDQQFWYNGNVCTNEEFPSGSFFGYNAIIQCCDDKFGPASFEDGTCLYKDICETVPPSPAPVTPAPSPQPISAAKPSAKPVTMSMYWDVIESFGSSGKSGKGYSPSGYGYSGSAGSPSKSGKGSSSKSSKGSSGKSGKGSGSSGGGPDGYGYDGYDHGSSIDGMSDGSSKSGKSPSGESGKGYELSPEGYADGHGYNGYDDGSSGASDGASSGESSKGEGYSGYSQKRNLRKLH
ncbi:hypothetical protein HJC23_013708 [Cyclotella cryptica]|uniref:Uncharacterized protein n=1 Tax=Cyclotella cryptica TaxID=29204 RepID=A0ABD3QUX8_9STRA